MGEGIGWAVKQLQNGERVRRAGWNGKGMWLALVNPTGPIVGVMSERAGLPRNHSAPLLPFVVMYTATGELVPWLCSQTDLLAVDWEIASAQATPTTVRAHGTSQTTCCFIPDDQQEAARNNRPYTACPKPAEWEVTEAKAPGYPTLACEEHVGRLLGAGLHYVAPFEATGSEPAPVVQTSAREV